MCQPRIEPRFFHRPHIVPVFLDQIGIHAMPGHTIQAAIIRNWASLDHLAKIPR
jgi:hypothetical protein